MTKTSKDEVRLNGSSAAFLERFGRLVEMVEQMKTDLGEHLKQSKEDHEALERHKTYWTLTLWLLGTVVVVGLGAIAAYFF